MTNRLYYNQTYLREFDAKILEIKVEDGKNLLRLDQSAFYPTSGGQPYDKGMLGQVQVLDVFVDEYGEVWHVVEQEADFSQGECIHGTIDWARRFDHMQQHAGEHLLAGMVYRQLNGMTIGLHLGESDSSIDVSLPDGRTHLTEQEIIQLEDEVNQHIQEDLPIRCWFPDAQELAQLPLRKAPTVEDHVRIVAMGDVEMVACGGTHPSSTGQIGLVKVLDARPARGKLRLTFICGMRAFRDYRAMRQYAQSAAAHLSTSIDKLPTLVKSLKDEMGALYHELTVLKRQQALHQVELLYQQAQLLPSGASLVTAQLTSIDSDGLREVASALIQHDNTIALLSTEKGDGTSLLLFARSNDLVQDMGTLIRQSGARGGGKPDFAQGSSTEAEKILRRAEEILRGN